MAVGPFDPVASWVTGGTCVANALVCNGSRRGVMIERAAGVRVVEVRPRAKLSGSLAQGCRNDIGRCAKVGRRDATIETGIKECN